MRRRLATVVLLGALLPLAACTPDGDPDAEVDAGARFSVPNVGPADIDVDTPQLRRLKRGAGVEPCVPGDGAPVDGGLPQLTLPCFGGGPDVELSALRGPLVVNLWAVWCAPCRREMPVLQEFYDQYGEQVGVLGIDYEDVQTRAAMELVVETGVTYPLLADPQSSLSGADPLPLLRGLPFLLLVDADGRVVHQEFVEIGSVDQLVGLVEQHLEVAL